MAPAPRQSAAGGPVRTLHGLADYVCGHTGSCCRAGWPIPIEDRPMALLRQAEAAGTLPRQALGQWADDGIIGHTANSECVFHATGATGAACTLESALGSEALPSSCRQFPRVLLTDARGWHQSLSSWCGTAARRLVTGTPATGVAPADASLFLSIDHINADPRVHVDALDASNAWPPFLRPGVLGGHSVYERWEARLLQDFLAPVLRDQFSLLQGLGSALCWTDTLRAWRSGDGCLEVLTGRPWRHPDMRRLARHPASRLQLESVVLGPLLARVPDIWRPPGWPQGLTDPSRDTSPITRAEGERALARYLATRLFASWVAYQGDGIRSVVASLVSAYVLATLALSRIKTTRLTFGHMADSLRASDWLLLHLLDREQWAAWCRQWETSPDATPLLQLTAGAQELLGAQPWAPADGADA